MMEGYRFVNVCIDHRFVTSSLFIDVNRCKPIRMLSNPLQHSERPILLSPGPGTIVSGKYNKSCSQERSKSENHTSDKSNQQLLANLGPEDWKSTSGRLFERLTCQKSTLSINSTLAERQKSTFDTVNLQSTLKLGL